MAAGDTTARSTPSMSDYTAANIRILDSKKLREKFFFMRVKTLSEAV